MRASVFALALFISLLGFSNASASVGQVKCVEDVCFEQQLTEGGETLHLVGLGKMRYWGFSLYVAALYLPSGANPQDVLNPEVKKKLVIHYLREFQPDDFIKSGEKTIRKNELVNFADIQGALAKFNKLYQPVKEGDRYSLAYTPQSGLALALNGEELGRVESAKFQEAYLGIWLGKYSISEELREKLLSAAS